LYNKTLEPDHTWKLPICDLVADFIFTVSYSQSDIHAITNSFYTTTNVD